MLEEAKKIIELNGYSILEFSDPNSRNGACDYVNRIIWISSDVSPRNQEALIVHEAIHVKNKYLDFAIKAKTTGEDIYNFRIKDEREAFIKQYEYASLFNPGFKDATKSLVNLHLRYYMRKEARVFANDYQYWKNLNFKLYKRSLILQRDGRLVGYGPTKNNYDLNKFKEHVKKYKKLDAYEEFKELERKLREQIK